MMHSFAVLAALFALWPDDPGRTSRDGADFAREVRPVLVSRCYRCHGAAQAESGLRLDSVAAMTAGGDRGPAIVPGQSAASLVIAAVRGSDELRMPPEGDPLTADEIDRIVRWIDAGAVPPEVDGPAAHWAFRAPVRPPVPRAGSAAHRDHPIDAFFARRHDERGLEPAGPAPPAVLLRRVYLDLVGVPPGEGELAAFVDDDAPDAYQRAVDRLLASPRYGERWGRHWMDIWRYSDWSGYKNEVRNSQPHIWRWRDWIVDSLNSDRPYDTMVAHMLAADELAPGDAEALPATGFLVRNWYKFNRNVWLDNTVEHTAKAFVGLTLGCARCHDHMYDPILQADYYRFRAIFEPHQIRTDAVPGSLDLAADGLVRVYDERLDAETYLFVRGDERHPDKAHVLAPALPGVFSATFEAQPVPLPVAAWYPGAGASVRADHRAAASKELAAAERAVAAGRAKLAAAERDLAAAPGAEPPEPVARFSDDFAAQRDDAWKIISGDWQYADGRLIQTRTGAIQQSVELVREVPADFEAQLAFRITGGEQWKSVGIAFDAADGRSHGVYLSAYAGEPKLQISHTEGGQTRYPPEGKKALPIAVDRDLRLTVQVHQSLVNVFVDDQFQLAYRLPSARRPGALAFWTFDASAAFSAFRLSELPAGMRLAQPGAGDPAEAVAEARYRLQLAEARHRAASSALVSLDARVSADDARLGLVATPDAARDALVQAAIRAEVEATLDQKRVLVIEAEHELEKFLRQRAGPAEKDAPDKELQQHRRKRDEAAEQLAKAERALDALPASYSPLGQVYPETSSGRRAALARWMTDPANPLLARVAVNHVWGRHFGRPLVPTVDDFGQNGQLPSHPELLDWMAVEFIESGWSLKHLHRLLVTSDAYRRHSAGSGGENARIDPENRELWRMNARRMEGEIVRDSVLSVGRDLDLQMGGPELDHEQGQTTRRRSVYYRHAYEKQMTFLKLFDAASVEECYRRSESVVPQQALALANSPLVIEQSRRIARELGASAAEPPDAGGRWFVRRAFLKILLREPAPDELADCLAFLASQTRLLAGDNGPLTPFEAGGDPPTPPAGDPEQRARENLVHVLLNHNEFITIR